MRRALIVAAVAGSLLAAAPAMAAKGTYAGTVTNTTGVFALDVKINRFGFVTKITHIRVKDVPSQCETSGEVPVHHDIPANVSVKENGKFSGSLTQPTYGNVSTFAGRIKHKHVSGTFDINYHYAAEGSYPEENCDTGTLAFAGKLGAPDATQTTAKAGR